MQLRHLLAVAALQATRVAAQEDQDFMQYVDPLTGTVDGGM